MKKKIFLLVAMVAMLACLFAISAFAATPDTTKETFTLENGTVLPIWDTDGNGLIWYKSTLNADDGYANYDYVHNNQKDNSQTPYISYGTWSGGTYGITGYQVSNFIITESTGTTHSSTAQTVVLANMKGSKYNDSNLFNCYNSAFRGNKVLEACYLDPETKILVTYVFNNCENLRYINLEETSIIALGGSANFAECKKLANITLPNTVTTVGEWQFQTTAITEFTIPESVVYWGPTNFKQCYNLENVYGFDGLFERGVLTTIPSNTFVDCGKVKMPFENGVFPEGITEIGAYAFDDCLAIGTIVVLPNSLEKIGQNAFQGCKSLEKVVLGASFTTWTSYDGFKNCSNLKEVYMPSTMTSIAGNVFNSSASDCVFYFTGTKAQLDTVKDNTVTNNSAFLDAYKKALSVDEYNALETKSGRYIVYDYNVCDAFYASTHEEDNNPCVVNCTRCNTSGVAEKNPVHTEVIEISYADFAKSGIKAVACSNAGCKHNVEEVAEALFTFKGYSTDGKEICVGYIINQQAIKEYDEHNGEAVLSYGLIVSANNNKPLDTSEKTINVDLTASNYTAIDFKLTGNWNEGDSAIAKFSMNIYTIFTNGDNVDVKYVYGYVDDGKLVGESYDEADQVSYNDLNPKTPE